mgnify:CR=1 FL=1
MKKQGPLFWENISIEGLEQLTTELKSVFQTPSLIILEGPLGAGKTTLFNVIAGVLKPTSGTVSMAGEDITGLPPHDLFHKGLLRTFQIAHEFSSMSVRENLTLPLVVSGREDEMDAGHLDDLLGWVGLTERGDALPPELSGGERQRAALARAIIMSPDLILADEPTGNVDWEMAQRLLALLVELNKMGKTIVIATHDLNLIRNLKTEISARVLRISNGKLQLAGADL